MHVCQYFLPSFLLIFPSFCLSQFLLPSTHSPFPLKTSDRPCACPPSQLKPVAIQKIRPKAHHRPQEEKTAKSAAIVLDESLLGAIRDVGEKLAPFKNGKEEKKGKKRKGTGRTRRRHRPKRQVDANQIVDPALAGPERSKCNSERIRQIILKARGRDSAALKRNIQALAERTFAARFNVVCARGDFSYISNTEEFCQDRVNGNTCYVFKQLGRDLPFPEPPELDQFERSFARKEQKWMKRSNNSSSRKKKKKKKAA